MRRYDAATSGEQRPTIYLFETAFIINSNVPPAIRAPLRDESNILETISQWRRATSLLIILANKYKRYNKGQAANTNRLYFAAQSGGLTDWRSARRRHYPMRAAMDRRQIT